MAEAKVVIRAVDEASSVLRQIQANVRGVFNIVGGIGALQGMQQLGDAFRAAGQAAVKFVNDAANAIEELDNLRTMLGLTAEQIQVVQFAFKQGGVDFDAFVLGLGTMSRRIADGDKALAKLGVSARDPFLAMMQASRTIAAMRGEMDRGRAAYDAFGKSGLRIVPIMASLADQWGDVSQRARDSGAVWDELAQNKLRQMESRLDILKGKWGGLTRQMAADAAGPLSTTLMVVDKLYNVFKAFGELSFWGKWAVLMRGGELRLPDRTTPTSQLGPITEERAAQIRDAQLRAAHAQEVAAEEARKNAEWFARMADTVFRAAMQDGGGTNNHLFGAMADRDAAFRERGRQNSGAMATGSIVSMAKEVENSLAKVVALNQVLRDSLETMRSVILSGWANVFQNLTNKMQTFRGAVRDLFNSLVQGVLAAVGQLLASYAVQALFQLLGVIVGFVTGNPALGAAVAGVGKVASGRGGSNATASAPGGDTYIIQTISPKDMYGSLVDPRGASRTANSRIFEIAAVS